MSLCKVVASREVRLLTKTRVEYKCRNVEESSVLQIRIGRVDTTRDWEFLRVATEVRVPHAVGLNSRRSIMSSSGFGKPLAYLRQKHTNPHFD